MSRGISIDENQSLPTERTNLRILIISGRSGSGKSSTAYEICHLLRTRKIPHAHIDGDNLDALYPRDDSPEMMLTNLKLVWTTFWTHFDDLRRKDALKKTFVVILSGTGMVLDLQRKADIFTDVLHRTNSSVDASTPVDVQVTPIVLESSDEIIEKRLRSREIGGELNEHLESSGRMKRVLEETQNGDVRRFVTDGMSVTGLAFEILKHIDIEI